MDKEMLKKDFADFKNVFKTAKGADIAKGAIKTLTGKAACALVALVLVIGIASAVGGGKDSGAVDFQKGINKNKNFDIDKVIAKTEKNVKKSLAKIPKNASKAPEEMTRDKLDKYGLAVEFLKDYGCKIYTNYILESVNYVIPAKVEGEPVVEVKLAINLNVEEAGLIHSVSFSDKLTTLKRFDTNGADVVIYNDNIKTLFENNPVEYFYCSAVLREDLVIPAAAQKAATRFVIPDMVGTKEEYGVKLEEGWEKISFVNINKDNPKPALEISSRFIKFIEFPSTLKEIVYASGTRFECCKYEDDKQRVKFKTIQFVIPDSLGAIKWTQSENSENEGCHLFENLDSTNEDNTYISKEDQAKLRKIGYEGPFVKDPNQKDDSFFGF